MNSWNSRRNWKTGILIEVTGQLKGIFPVYAERSLYQDRNKYHFGEEERNLTSLDDMECSLIRRAGEHHVRFLHTGPVPADGYGYGCVGAGAALIWAGNSHLSHVQVGNCKR